MSKSCGSQERLKEHLVGTLPMSEQAVVTAGGPGPVKKSTVKSATSGRREVAKR